MKKLRTLVLSVVLVLILLVVLLPSFPVSAAVQTVTSTLSSQADTGTVFQNDTGVWTFASNQVVQVGYYSSTIRSMSSGMRFNNVTIPQAAVITQAYVLMYAYGDAASFTQVPTTFIQGQASSNSTSFSSYNDYTQRYRTNSSVSWTVSAWASGQGVQTPDLSVIIQEITSRTDWASGASVTLFWSDTTDQQAGFCRRAYGYGGSLPAPVLYISYDWAGASYNPYTGMSAADIARMFSSLSSLGTSLSQLQGTVTSVQDQVTALSKTASSSSLKASDVQQATQQGVVNALANDATLKSLAVSLSGVSDSLTKTNTALKDVGTALTTLGTQQNAVVAGVADIQKTLKLPAKDYTIYFMVLGFLIVLAAAFIYLFTNRPARPVEPSSEPPEPPDTS